jgi:cytochrome c oxidase subunit 1
MTINTPMIYALGFVAVFTVGGISGVMHSQAASDAQQQDTYFIVAHIHYVLFGGAIFGLIGGIYYWFPKFTGRMFDEKLGQLSFWLIFIGTNITFFPMHFTGLDGMPRRIYTYGESMGWSMWNSVSTAGAGVLAIGLLVLMANLIRSWRSGEPANGDPWDARTLEWSIPSPPPEYNFAEIPTVQDRDDWWATKRRRVRTAVPAGGGSGEDEGHSIHLPQPSYWPIIAAIGLLVGGYGLIYNIAVAAIGGAITVVAVYAWSFEPVNDPDEGEAH